MVSARNLSDFVVRKLAPGPVHEMAEIARINKQHLAAAVAPAFAGIFVSGQEPEARWDLC